ncbi:MAG: hypothetical protein ACIAS6_07520 [Phycisphaerales bacterium JB060]
MRRFALLTPGSIVGNLRVAVSKTTTPNTFDATDWHFFNFDMFTDISALRWVFRICRGPGLAASTSM